jgi:hypothetical protein
MKGARVLGNFIAGDWADAVDGEALDVINPSTAETIERVPRRGEL